MNQELGGIACVAPEEASSPKREVFKHSGAVSLQDRARLLRQRPSTVWFTGLSGAGKSTLAYEMERRLLARNRLSFVLDGDNLRHHLNRDLGFSAREEYPTANPL